MPRDYSWARQTIPQHTLTIGQLAAFLGVERHQARRLLVRSGLPCRLVVRRWMDDDRERWFVRKAWAVPLETANTLRESKIQKLCKHAQRVRAWVRARLDAHERRRAKESAEGHLPSKGA